MNKYEWLDSYLLSMTGCRKDYKIEWEWFRYQVGGRLFAAVCEPDEKHGGYGGRELVSLKCEPLLSEAMRREYPDIVPGFYMDKRNWISVFLDGDVPEEVLRSLCERSHALVFAKLTRKAQRELTAQQSVSLRPVEDSDLDLIRSWMEAPHAKRWFEDPGSWLREIGARDGEYRWITHRIAEDEHGPFGYCQYYSYDLGGETWHGDMETRGAYSIDYLIGEPDRLGRGMGRAMVMALVRELMAGGDAKRVIAQPERENLASRGTLLSCGFVLDEARDVFVYEP